MSYSYDYFVGRLACPHCGKVSAPDSSTNMQTYIRDESQLAFLGEGAAVDVSPANMRDSSYYVVREPQPGEVVKILQTWECPSCGKPSNWAVVSVKNGRIQGVAAVPLNRQTFERAHYISLDADGVAADVSGRPVTEIVGEDVVAILREHLA